MTSATYTRSWLETNSFDPNAASRRSDHDDEAGLATRLYVSCRESLADVCSLDPSGSRSLLLREELAKLYLWGRSFGPGELDAALEYSEDARHVVLNALSRIGRSLLRDLPPETTRSKERIGELRQLVEESRVVISTREEQDEKNSSDDGCSDATESLSDDEDSANTVQEIGSHLNHLVQLGPTLQRDVLYAYKARTTAAFPPIVPFHLSDPAKIYVSLIREKYPDAEDQLVDRLGEANWQRHQTIRDQIEANDLDEGQDDSCSAFRPYSAFHDSGLGTSVPAYTEYASSHTSFQSSNAEGEEGALRVPAAPDEMSAGKPFTCPYCGIVLNNVKNRVAWKMHVFADLQPYLCTFANCREELAQFASRAEWAKHEYTKHRVHNVWSCPECSESFAGEFEWEAHLSSSHQRRFTGSNCSVAKAMACTTLQIDSEDDPCPLCRVALGVSRRDFVKHVGRHMEEIALMALPKEHLDDEASDLESTSTAPIPSSEPTMRAEQLLRRAGIDPKSLSPAQFASFFRHSPRVRSKWIQVYCRHSKPQIWPSANQIKSFDGDPPYVIPALLHEPAAAQEPAALSYSENQEVDPGAMQFHTSDCKPLRGIDHSPVQKRESMASPYLFRPEPPPELSREDMERGGGRCPNPDCGRKFKDLKAHMLTHQSERPEKCPIVSCEYHQKGFARKYDRRRHMLTHYKGIMVCDFCPGAGFAAEKSFNRADVFKRHLTSVHGAEQIPPNSRAATAAGYNSLFKKTVVDTADSRVEDAPGKCSTCKAMFRNAQDFYEHLDDCVLSIVQQEEQLEIVTDSNGRRDSIIEHRL